MTGSGLILSNFFYKFNSNEPFATAPERSNSMMSGVQSSTSSNCEACYSIPSAFREAESQNHSSRHQPFMLSWKPGLQHVLI